LTRVIRFVRSSKSAAMEELCHSPSARDSPP
jgi:hypothetical protein